MIFEEVELKDEVELENMVKQHIGTIEKGLIYLDSQRPVGGGRLDVLAMDENKRLVVIELKMREDDYMLMQTLEYLDYINKNKDRIADFYSKQRNVEIEKDVAPRIILIAPSFSETLKKAIVYIDETYSVDLFTFRYLKVVDTGKCAPLFLPVEIMAREEYIEPITIDDHINYITNPEVREVCKTVKTMIENIGDVTCVPRAYWLTFFCGGRRFATIQTRRNFFDVYACIPQKGWDDWDYISVRKKEDFTQEFLEKIKEQYVKVGGKLKHSSS